MSAGHFVRELRRRRVFRTSGFYVVGAWLVMQAADVFFPAWGIPDAAINALLVAAILGFPLALVFGWFYDVTAQGIVRTAPAAGDGGDRPGRLQRTDYLILAALAIIAVLIVQDAARDILSTAEVAEDAILDSAEAGPDDKLPNSLAVLPFTNISNDAENEVFCDGISEEILNRLASYAGLNVIARTSSFAFKGSDYRVPRISALLGVRYLLQGSVRKQGNRLRISAQLLDENGAQRWSNTFDRTLNDIFAIQSEIAEIVASTVVPQIVAPPAAYQPKLDAYQNFLAGRELLRRRAWVKTEARAQLLKAVELDPKFAAAYAELAITYIFGMPEREDFDRARQAIDTALRLEPGMPRALAARGLMLSQQANPDWEAAEAALRQALDGDPNMVDALNWLSSAVDAQGKHAEGRELQERAARLDPLNGAIAANIANGYADRGDYARAEQQLLRLLELPDPGMYPYLLLLELYWQTGRLVDLHANQKRFALTGQWDYYGLALVYALLGHWEQAAYWTARSQRDFPDTFWSQFMPSFVPFWRGRYRESLAELDRAIDASGKTLAEMPASMIAGYGETQALAGDYEGAIRTLESLLDPAKPIRYGQFSVWEKGVPHCLAWSYLKSGAEAKGRSLLADLDRELQDLRREGRLHRSGDLYFFARNALLLGDHELALDRLEQAVEAGWRDYYIHVPDPRWETLRDDPRYRALMAKVKADVDRQGLEIARVDAEEDFPAVLDRAQSAAAHDSTKAATN